MYRKSELPELLCPAGDMDCLYAAVSGGADAVYVGGKRFGARAFAKNFDMDELRSAVSYCHLHDVKLYVTLNTLVEDREIAEAVEYAAELYRIGVDALIIADVGVIEAIRRHVPDLELHASTQMSLHSTDGVVAASKLGISRAVVARELSLENITSIVENSPCEIEIFLHGALCVCHSGQCLFSSMVGGRSGNRGECAQPCRLPYNGGKYPLSLKDLSLADHIPALIESGVASLKIEGRMKSPDYVYTVARIYRSLLDEGRCATEEENLALRRAFSRGGFTDGYLTERLNSPMTGIRSDDDKQQSRDAEFYEPRPERVAVRASVSMHLGMPSRLTLTNGNRTATVFGAVPQVAENAPLTHDGLSARLSKMGNTLLSLNPEDIEIDLGENLNLPPSAVNALRRSAAEAFEYCGRDLDEVKYIPIHNEIGGGFYPKKSAQFFSEAAFVEACDLDSKLMSELDLTFISLYSSEENLSLSSGIYLPPIITDSEKEKVMLALEKAKKCGIMYALVSNLGQISLVFDYGMTPVGDFRLNVTNCESRRFYKKMGVEHLILSPELTLPKARDIGGGLITYGRIPLMITERCFIRESFGCKNCGKASLTDRKGEKFPMKRESDHRNLIFNSLPTYMGDKQQELFEMKLRSHHLLFTVEEGSEILEILRNHKLGRPLAKPVRRVGRR